MLTSWHFRTSTFGRAWVIIPGIPHYGRGRDFIAFTHGPWDNAKWEVWS